MNNNYPYKMIKLDIFDKRILEVLINNSREQVSTIAKKVRLGRENVNYRINRLVKLGLIKDFNTIINEEKLELSHHVVFLELIKLEEKTEKEIIDYLKKNPFMSWIGTSAGKWSLVFDIITQEKNSNLKQILRNFLEKFQTFIENYEILKLSESDYFVSKLIGESTTQINNLKNKNKTKLDENDLKILASLNNNSRKTLVDISQKIKLTPNGVNNRIKSLIKNNIICGFTVSLDWKKLDYELFTIQIKLHKYSEKINKQIRRFFTNHDKIIFYYKYTEGSWDYDIGILVKNSNELRNFINEYRKYFSEVSKISDVFLVLEETTSHKMPAGIFN
ncbi:MAG: winged helix-turn-helix transcriptional regulator [archaeon]